MQDFWGCFMTVSLGQVILFGSGGNDLLESSEKNNLSQRDIEYCSIVYIYDGITLKYLRAAIEATDDTIYEMYFQYGQTGLEAIEYIHGSLKDTYYVVSNLQGDVIGLIDGSGTEVVSYTYDAWGQLRSMTGSLASTLGTFFRGPRKCLLFWGEEERRRE